MKNKITWLMIICIVTSVQNKEIFAEDITQNNDKKLTLSPGQMQKLSQLFKNDSIDATTHAAIEKVIPVSPEGIEALKEKKSAIDKVIQASPIQTNQLVNTVRAISLLNNAPPPLLHFVVNYAANISFKGENGKPWPIQSVVSGNDQLISVKPISKDDPYNSSIIVNKPWGSTNLTFYLRGRVQPVVIYAVTAPDPSQLLDSLVDITLDGVPPGTAPLAIKNVGAVSDALLNAVNNAPGNPWQSVNLNNSNLPIGLNMWVSADHSAAIVRVTSGQLVSPDWSSQANNADNTATAYAFNYIPLMLLVNTNDGQSYQVGVKQAIEALANADSALSEVKKTEITNVSDIEKDVRKGVFNAKK